MRASGSAIRTLIPVGSCLLPFAPVEWDHRYGIDRAAVDAARIDADAVWMRARNIERLDAAVGAEMMLRDVRVEGVRHERFAAREQRESLGGHDEMKIA